MSVLGWVLGGISVVGILGAVVYYIRKAVLNVARVDSLQATTELQEERIRVQDEAEREARVKARKETDAKVGSAQSVDDVAELLGDAFPEDSLN